MPYAPPMARIDLRPLLKPEGRGDAINIYGVRPGDAAAKLRDAPLTGGEDRATGKRSYHSGKIFRRLEDGSEEEIPLTEIIASVLENGGWLRAGSIAFAIDGGKVSRIFVRGPSLETLGIQRLEEITKLFGRPEGIERTLGWVVHHYPSRSLVVAWHAREGRLEHIALGPDDWRSMRYGTRDLLGELVRHWEAFEALQWREPAGGSIQARYQRVAALARAFELGSVGDVAEGAFIERDPARYGSLLDAIAARGPFADRSPQLSHARWVYTHLLHYRVDAQRVIAATSGWLECSDPALLGMIATQNAIAGDLQALLAPIDGWLRAFLGGDDRTFDERFLIEKLGWPDVDIGEMEAEEW